MFEFIGAILISSCMSFIIYFPIIFLLMVFINRIYEYIFFNCEKVSKIRLFDISIGIAYKDYVQFFKYKIKHSFIPIIASWFIIVIPCSIIGFLHGSTPIDLFMSLYTNEYFKGFYKFVGFIVTFGFLGLYLVKKARNFVDKNLCD